MTKLIVIRGNSGSGKSSLALSLREALVKSGTKSALISQDYFRRTMLKVKETHNSSPRLEQENEKTRAPNSRPKVHQKRRRFAKR